MGTCVLEKQENICNDRDEKEDFKNQSSVLNSLGEMRSQEAQQQENNIDSVIDGVIDTAKRLYTGCASSSDDEDDVLISEIIQCEQS